MSDKKIIELDGERYEVIPFGTMLAACPHCMCPKSENGIRLIPVRPVPKPLREEWQVLDCSGECICGDCFDTLAKAQERCDWRNKNDCWDPYTVVHMREVREEGKS